MATSVLYPLLIAPAWLADDMETTYRLAKWINVVVMSGVAVPVYLWARRLAGRRAGLLAAGLSLLLPALVYTGSLLTENLFLPLFVASAYALARALESPSPATWLVALVAVSLAVATRAQGVLVLPIAVTAALAFAAIDAPARGRPVAVSFRPLLAGTAAAAAAAIAVAATGSLPLLDVGAYEGFRAGRVDPAAAARWVALDAGSLVVASGVLPAIALVVLCGRAVAAPGRTTRAERAFLATAASSLLWLVVLAGIASTSDPVGIRERYVVHGVPLLLVGLAVWLARDAPRPRIVTAVGAAAAVALVAALPLRTVFASGSFLGDGFSLIPFWRLARVLPGEVGAARGLLVAGAIGAALLFALVPRRLAAPVLPLLVGAFLVASSAAVFATARSQALGVALASGQADRPTWIDDAVGDSHVVFLNLGPAEAPEWIPVWQAEFWNRSLRGVLNVEGAVEPSPLPQRAVRRLAGVDAPYVLVRDEVEVEGALLAESGGLRLYRVEPPLRLVGTP